MGDMICLWSRTSGVAIGHGAGSNSVGLNRFQ